MNLLKGSFVLKISAFIFALLTYFYVHAEILREETKVYDPSYKLIKLTTRQVPINVRLSTAPPEGYQVILAKVSAKPSQIVVVGPEALMDESAAAETALIDISESTRTIQKKIQLETVAGLALSGEPYMVEVTVPIEKIQSA